MRQIIFLLSFCAASALAVPFSLSTGVAAWQVSQIAGTSNNGLPLDTSNSAVVLTGVLPTSLAGSGQWATPVPGSAWIGQLATDGNFENSTVGAMPGVYQYKLTFSAGIGGTFSLAFTGDNSASLSVFQGATELYSGYFGNPATLATTGLIIYGTGGNIVITANVINGTVAPSDPSRNPSGFLLSGVGDAFARADVPEPATYSMIGLGIAAMVGVGALRGTGRGDR